MGPEQRVFKSPQPEPINKGPAPQHWWQLVNAKGQTDCPAPLPLPLLRNTFSDSTVDSRGDVVSILNLEVFNNRHVLQRKRINMTENIWSQLKHSYKYLQWFLSKLPEIRPFPRFKTSMFWLRTAGPTAVISNRGLVCIMFVCLFVLFQNRFPAGYHMQG